MARRQHQRAGAKLHVAHAGGKISHEDNRVEGGPRRRDAVADPHRVDVPTLAVVDKLENTVRRFAVQRTITQSDPDADFQRHPHLNLPPSRGKKNSSSAREIRSNDAHYSMSPPALSFPRREDLGIGSFGCAPPSLGSLQLNYPS